MDVDCQDKTRVLISLKHNISPVFPIGGEEEEKMPFEYTLPTTGAFSYSTFISSPPVRLNAPLAEAAAQRGRLRDILKRLKRADDKDILAVIKVHTLLPVLRVEEA